ncbi:hypothetical protein GCM10010350_73300 [Streptomyces galilaeus]|nr:hypothetical protein GCM10010350_73300 [Streptomyces galilaeus]
MRMLKGILMRTVCPEVRAPAGRADLAARPTPSATRAAIVWAVLIPVTPNVAGCSMVEKYRKVGLRRAGKRTDDGTRARALSMLRVQAEEERA